MSSGFSNILTYPKRSHIVSNLMSLHWLLIKICIHFRIWLLTFKAWDDQTPPCIYALFLPQYSFLSTDLNFWPFLSVRQRVSEVFSLLLLNYWEVYLTESFHIPPCWLISQGIQFVFGRFISSVTSALHFCDFIFRKLQRTIKVDVWRTLLSRKHKMLRYV